MSQLDVIPLGGMGNVTQNMFLYVHQDEILIVDCGIGFPDIQMPGADILIPDTRHLHQLLDEGKQIVGMILTHGHDDHIAATPYILPELPEFPIYASELTAGFAKNRMKDGKVERKITVVKDAEWFTIGSHFQAKAVAITHSVPDTRHYFIKTPAGTVYHGSDFKLDPTPVDGQVSDETTVKTTAEEERVLCAMIDCLRVENDTWVESENTTGPAISAAMANTKGKVLVTLMSSHIHRIQQTIDAAVEHGRKVAFIGRSVEQNVEVAFRLNKLTAPEGTIVDKRDTEQVADAKLCLIVAGSQGQEGSSLVRAVFGEHPMIRIKPSDKVLFSADAIPGNEINFYGAIDELARNNIEVVYPAIEPNMHKSGHASAPEQAHMLSLLQPAYTMPIGGADRHRYLYTTRVADQVGLSSEQVLRPDSGQILSFINGTPEISGKFEISPRIVDGLGIGDVGPAVLSDRRTLGESGIVVVLIPKTKGAIKGNQIQVISRGFVFMKQAQDVVKFIKDHVAQQLKKMPNKTSDGELKQQLQKSLSKKLFKIIRRDPMIVVELVD